jgi:hypothetical protein
VIVFIFWEGPDGSVVLAISYSTAAGMASSEVLECESMTLRRRSLSIKPSVNRSHANWSRVKSGKEGEANRSNPQMSRPSAAIGSSSPCLRARNPALYRLSWLRDLVVQQVLAVSSL